MYTLTKHESRSRGWIPIIVAMIFSGAFLHDGKLLKKLENIQTLSDCFTVENLIILFCFLAVLSGIKIFINPYHFISCNYKGIYIGKKKQFIKWGKIADISKGKIQTGGKINDPKYSPAIIIKLTDDLFDPGIFMHEHAKYINQRTFTFKDNNPEETIDSILKFWTNDHPSDIRSKMDPEIKKLLESGDKINALKLCKEKLNLSLKESKEYIEKHT